MDTNPGPYTLSTDAYIMTPDGQGIVKPFGPAFYEEIVADFNEFKGHALVQQFAFSEPWPSWEAHPNGDEMVYLLTGDTDFALWRDGREEVVRISKPGDYVRVPRGLWHTARPHAPTNLLFITPGEGTLHAESPSD
ncbi:MAG: cupin domain-containing protein [Halioglobus sp.]